MILDFYTVVRLSKLNRILLGAIATFLPSVQPGLAHLTPAGGEPQLSSLPLVQGADLRGAMGMGHGAVGIVTSE